MMSGNSTPLGLTLDRMSTPQPLRYPLEYAPFPGMSMPEMSSHSVLSNTVADCLHFNCVPSSSSSSSTTNLTSNINTNMNTNLTSNMNTNTNLTAASNNHHLEHINSTHSSICNNNAIGNSMGGLSTPQPQQQSLSPQIPSYENIQNIINITTKSKNDDSKTMSTMTAEELTKFGMKGQELLDKEKLIALEMDFGKWMAL